MTIVLIQHTI